MQKMKRIIALTGVVVLVGMYLVTLVLGVTASPATKDLLMASIACTVIIPCLMYGFMLVARVLDNRHPSETLDVTEKIKQNDKKGGKK